MPKSTKELEEQIRLARTIQWQHQLDGFTEEALKPLQQAVSQAQSEVMAELELRAMHPTPTDFPWEQRSKALLDELNSLSGGIQNYLTGHIADMAGHAGSAALEHFNQVLSWDGKVIPFNAVALTVDQVRQLALETPVGGRLLSDWVGRTFDENMVSGIKREITAGMLKGEGYPDLVSRIQEGWDTTKTEAITLARSYVQSANVGAMQSVYKANQDIVKGWRWCATLEIGGSKGGGTCMQCACLDGREFGMNEANVPDIPLHPRCRCVPICITKTWRELGLDINEMEQVYRPWTRSDLNIDEGRGGQVLMQGFHQGSFADLFPTLSREDQLHLVGPGRMGLIDSGTIKFEDLVDPTTGQIRLLEGTPGNWTGLKGLGSGGEGFGGLELAETKAAEQGPLPFTSKNVLGRLSELLPGVGFGGRLKWEASLLDDLAGIANDLSRVRTDFPTVAEILDNNKVVKDIGILPKRETQTYGLYANGKLRLNMYHLYLDMEDNLQIGGFNLASDLKTVFRHELGHGITDHLDLSGLKTLYDSKPREYWAKTVSKYGSCSFREFFAESFSAYTSPVYGKKGFRRLPKEIEEYFDKLLRRK